MPKNMARISEYFLTIEIIIPPIRNPKRYPPVGPKSAFKPPFPPAKTGSPIPPRSKYANMIKKVSTGEKYKLMRKRKNTCKVKGT